MADSENAEEAPEKKRSKLPLILGLALALAGGGGSFFAVYSGILPGTSEHASSDGKTDRAANPMEVPDVAFVPVDPLVIGLGRASSARHLRFRAQLEVPSDERSQVEALLPRVVDVMNTYLRAVEISDLEDPSALVRLRSQLLRRVQVVTGQERVNDLLIMEFVVS